MSDAEEIGPDGRLARDFITAMSTMHRAVNSDSGRPKSIFPENFRSRNHYSANRGSGAIK